MRDLIYILSTSFSGSTLLTLLLDAHPKIATIGELKGTQMGDVNEYACSCGEIITKCAFFQKLIVAMQQRGATLDLTNFGTHFRAPQRLVTDRVLRTAVRGPLFESGRQAALTMIPGARRHLDAILEQNRRLIESVCEVTGASAFLDGSKDPFRLLCLRDAGSWNIKVIFMVRDGRGSANSFQRNHRLSIEDACREWRRGIEECQRVLRDWPREAQTTLRYEDLCRDPDARVREILTFCGVGPIDIETSLSAKEHHIIGNRMRVTSRDEIRLDERWRTRMSESDLATFERIAGDLNRSYGYE